MILAEKKSGFLLNIIISAKPLLFIRNKKENVWMHRGEEIQQQENRITIILILISFTKNFFIKIQSLIN